MGGFTLNLLTERPSFGDISVAHDAYSDPVELVRESEAYCFNNVEYGMQYVDAIIQLAKWELAPKINSLAIKSIVTPILDDIIAIACFRPVTYKKMYDFPKVPSHWKSSSTDSFSGWPKISEFNIKLGAEKLEQYIDTWQRSDEWMCYVEFLGFESEESANYFVYEVEFSIPTREHPIPQATASVYFSLEVSKMVPASYDRQIEVSYVFESSNVIYVPGTANFQENRIRSIIQCKSQYFKKLTF